MFLKVYGSKRIPRSFDWGILLLQTIYRYYEEGNYYRKPVKVFNDRNNTGKLNPAVHAQAYGAATARGGNTRTDRKYAKY